MANNVFLIGPMGSGKTTIGRNLAKILNYEFFDIDQEIEQRLGVSKSWILDVEGEIGFRQREIKLIDELSKNPETVLATGCGAVESEENCTNLAARGLVVYLDMPLQMQAKRLQRDENKYYKSCIANLSLEELASIQAKRSPLYETIADVIIPTSGKSVGVVIKELRSKLSSYPGFEILGNF